MSEDLDVARLKSSLAKAQALLIKQAAVIRASQEAPNRLAVVLGVTRNIFPRSKDFTMGLGVKVTNEADGIEVVGVVQDLEEIDDGWVRVRVADDSGNVEDYSCFVDAPNTAEARKRLVERGLHVVSPLHWFYTRARILDNGRIVELGVPEGVVPTYGQTIAINTQTDQFVGLAGPSISGILATVATKPVSLATKVEVALSGQRQVIWKPASVVLEQGDTVEVDLSGQVMLGLHEKAAIRAQAASTKTVLWEDIAGLEEAKEALRFAVEASRQHHDLFAYYGNPVPSGILLYGRPGNGKTMLATAAATAIASMYGKDLTDSGFIYVKGPELLDPYVGETEAAIRRLFSRARAHLAQYGYPAVIFLDEADALLPTRGSRHSSDVEATTVPQFLAEMDGMDRTGALVLLSTNKPNSLDPAVLRDGRVDTKIHIPAPARSMLHHYFRSHLGHVHLDPSLELDACSRTTADLLFHDAMALYRVYEGEDVTRCLTLGHIVSGSMVANIVRESKTFAIRRSLREGTKPMGLTAKDLVQGMSAIHAQHLEIEHEEELAEFLADLPGDRHMVKKLRSEDLIASENR